MSQMHQLSACPNCEESLDEGDLFCGACGYDLSAVPRPPARTPGGAPREAAVGRAAAWPAAREADSEGRPAPVHRGADVRGTASDGTELPAGHPEPPGRPAASGDGEDYALPAPGAAAPPPPPAAPPAAPPGPAPGAPADPRTAVPPAAQAGPLCVACRSGRVDPDGYCEHCGHAQPRERDHMEQELSAVAAVSDRGLRHHRNEDAFAVSATTLADGTAVATAIVCDGVSSATRPDEASLAAARAADASLMAALPRGTHPRQAMYDAILAASEAVNSLAQDLPPVSDRPQQNAPACTLVGAVVGAGLLVVGWVGDSRVYWVPDDPQAPPHRLTEDDSWAAQMVAARLMSEAEAYADERAHAITGWLGADAYELEPHTASFTPDRPGVVVVCTDGLWNYAESAREMAGVVPADAARRPLHSARALVGHALDGGGHDNVTVAILPFEAARTTTGDE
ncbi:PP2C family serine/threonine-protein phosphatase [Streptomyces sp. NPDC007088]|uniref:PP2C family serine/threonine-protein phosphatase n=1 Tax=Streptomyces sp. NPDC007088 TaxID=3364773 RepID=UPI00367DF499